MSNIGWFLPIFVVFVVGGTILLGLIDHWLEPKSEWEKYLERRLERYPDYIEWLKVANGGRDYKLGLRILARIERDKNNSYKRWLKRIRKIGKW